MNVLRELKWVGVAGRWGSIVAGWSLMVMAFLGTIDIIGRKFFNWPLPSTLEATEALMVLGIFMALANTQAQRGHIRVDILFSRFPALMRRILGLIAHLLTLTLSLFIAWQGWLMGLHSWSVREYAAGLISFPIYPSKVGLAVGASLMALQCVRDVVEESASFINSKGKVSNA